MEINNISINNIIYNLENEELDDIDYYEILSFDEIVKNNPTFIAFSRNEIYDELYNFFKNNNKSQGFVDLFYKTIDYQNNIIDTTNYVVITDSYKKNYECELDNVFDFINSFKKINKLQINLALNEKNKLLFSIEYDNDSKKIRFKPLCKTYIEINRINDNLKENLEENINFDINDFKNIQYPLFKEDDTNIPVDSIYYKKPTYITNDYLADKILSILNKPQILNHISTDNFDNINKVFNKVKPNIDDIINDINNNLDIDDFDLNYNHINNIIEKLDKSFDNLNIDEFINIKNTISKHIDKIIPHKKLNTKKYKNKQIIINNNKILFFEKIQKIPLLLVFTDKLKQDYESLIIKFKDNRININKPPLLYSSIFDMIYAINNGIVSLDDVIDNISNIKNAVILDHSINTINDYLNNSFDKTKELLDIITERFKLLKNAIYDISNLHFIDFYQELKDIKDGNDISNYEGIPSFFTKNANFEENKNEIDDENDFDETNIVDFNKTSILFLEKYWLSFKYKDSVGFVELLKVLLPLLAKIQDVSKLQLNYDLLCEELFNKFKGVPTKLKILTDKLNESSIILTNKKITEIVNISPHIAFSTDKKDDFIDLLIDINKTYIKLLFSMLFTSLAWWSLNVQKEIINDTILFDDTLYYIPFIDKWSYYGLPLNNNKTGVLVYLSFITEEIFIEKELYTVPANIIDNSMTIINNDYTDFIELLRKNSKDKDKNLKKQDKGAETQLDLVKSIKNKNYDIMIDQYVSAFVYMPALKYKKIHKFLLGCCLQKIDIHFKPDSDLIGVRNDLLVVKNKFAKNRETNKPRSLRYLPIKIKNKNKDFDDNDLIIIDKYFLPIDTKHDINDITIDIWLNNMINKSPFLPLFIIDEFLKNTKSANDYIIKYINIFTNTAGIKKSDFLTFFDIKDIKIKNILMNITVIIYKSIKLNNYNDTEIILLNDYISHIKNIIQDIDILDSIINDYNIQDIIRIKKYITARVLCSPCDPDSSVGNILKPENDINISNNFILNISKNIYTDILSYLKSIKMPTLQDNINMINSIRETNKNKTLLKLNKRTEEDRELFNQLKKIGISLEQYDEDTDIINNGAVNDNYDEDIINDINEENDFNIDDEEYDNPDDLDNENHGFVYN